MNPTTNRAQDFLDLLERAKRGRLKIYLGFAAGVGKTVRMLKEAHALKLRGVDVVLAYIEPHGRAETAELIGDLEVIPRKQFVYRGITVEEMDLDAVLARRPEIAIVDEVAHTNVPLCRHRKRYQDILEITEAGINVICAFNIQHLESLNDLIERVTGVVVRETIPDTFVKEADQVVTVDLSVDDLMERLKSGKIYTRDKIPWALEHFFRIANLSTLRELALLEVAESLGRRQPSGPEELKLQDRVSLRTLGRVMVCMASASPRAKTLLRKGSRMAGRLNTHWFVVYVETPGEAPTQIEAETQRHLLENFQKARELGAEVIRLQAKDPVPAILDFARSHGVGHIVIGRSQQPWWRKLLGRSVSHRIIDEAAGFDVHVISFEEEE
ncbi:sensor protein KdpD [Desulfobacca acetoxidans]|uniref:Osmosensitive K channel His kinase sensor n=1 Tax=Desulfobacca acetoxidans (strain ATCC 700848 / DSM 11109 / ASRB2) TaxID=880072 RepID=F2NIP5_DESAR|nr:universal stress protein [Desulfobacca acetoxidans]AEB10520.1 Osmosensitive K channel His kinase sensor [Desulfobacca acetoxidans DSM 11109]